MNIKSHQPIHKKAYPYVLLIIGICLGLGIAIDWDIKVTGDWDVSFKTKLETEKSIWDVLTAIGSIVGGFSTFGLFICGLRWLRNHLLLKKIDEKLKRTNSFIDQARDVERLWTNELNRIFRKSKNHCLNDQGEVINEALSNETKYELQIFVDQTRKHLLNIYVDLIVFRRLALNKDDDSILDYLRVVEGMLKELYPIGFLHNYNAFQGMKDSNLSVIKEFPQKTLDIQNELREKIRDLRL